MIEREIEVPALLLPTVELPAAPIPVAEASLVGTTYRQSFHQTRRLANQGAAGAFTEEIARPGRGLWEFEARLTGVSSFTTADFLVNSGVALQVLDPAGGITHLLEHELVANVPMFLRHQMRWLLDEDGWVFRALIPATAAGQTVVGMFGVRANLLV